MNAVDTSVLVPLLAGWHEAHELAARLLAEAPFAVPVHALLEAYSVLTRLPPPLRAEPDDVRHALRARLSMPPLALDAEAHVELLGELARAGIGGGATYDALVGVTARRAGAELLTLDRRAVRVYEALGVAHRVLTGGTGERAERGSSST